jgi:catechol 2,3-dioxygenase-like lactoylglutathione lyase family enzyme
VPCIHPSENPPLGWLVPCLAVADLKASLEFYGKLDLVMFGGNVEENWAMLRNRAIEIHLFEGHIPNDLLNFRGGDLPAIRVALEERGFTVASEQGPVSHTLLDPDGREVFFDTSKEENERYPTGQPLTIPIEEDDVHAGTGMDLGNLAYCLACKDLKTTLEFYRTLGMVLGHGDPDQGWAVLSRADHAPEFGKRLITTCLSLFQDMIPKDTINFRGGNVAGIAATLGDRGVDLGDGVQVAEDGGESLFIADPDGRPVLFDTTPPERLY